MARPLPAFSNVYLPRPFVFFKTISDPPLKSSAPCGVHSEFTVNVQYRCFRSRKLVALTLGIVGPLFMVFL